MGRLLMLLAGLVAAGLVAFWVITAPDPLPDDAMAGLKGDASRGELVFWAGGCASCHADPQAKGADQLKLGGGQRLESAFGTFLTPNISPDPTHGIGAWTLHDFADAMLRGIRKDGAHLYPAFPYSSYDKMTKGDVADLWAYLRTLPPVATPSQPHELSFPFSIRRLVGGYNFLFVSTDWVVTGDLTPVEERGRYLVEAVSHCGQCHTPRNALGGMQTGRWLAGAANPDGKGRIPNITPAALSWSRADIVAYLSTGLTPEFDSAGGHMAYVVENMGHLPKSDVEAIAAYLKKVPPMK
ncbi:c-type cytochrome [Acidimangrovimonas sediminis]|uniref:c-type cytochrome n=1 Tax=Acidimangrovimonas sediminis TaxID=2056283 RepID=UPI000C804D32|nr:cytochrome c [Acidimangrovimonas sediminis]